MKTSYIGIELIKKYEGFKSSTYICPAGKKTIGYGHVIKTGESYTYINAEQANSLLINDLAKLELFINKVVTVPINQNQFDALISLNYNWGSDNFLKSKGLAKLNNSDYEGAIIEFKEVNKVNGKILTGLVKRRQEESELFIKGTLSTT